MCIRDSSVEGHVWHARAKRDHHLGLELGLAARPEHVAGLRRPDFAHNSRHTLVDDKPHRLAWPSTFGCHLDTAWSWNSPANIPRLYIRCIAPATARL